MLRYFGDAHDDRLVLVNLGQDLPLDPCPEPLLAPPAGKRWSVIFSTEDPAYGGNGTPHPDTEEEGWQLHGRSAVVLKPVPADDGAVKSRIVVQGSAQEAIAKPEKKPDMGRMPEA